MRLIPVECLRIGDMIDLRDDPYADPAGEPSYEFELQEVVEWPLRESATLISIEFATAWVGFPAGYRLRVEGNGMLAYPDDGVLELVQQVWSMTERRYVPGPTISQ